MPADREKNVWPRVNKNVKTSEGERERQREANSFSFASGKFAERSVFQGRRLRSPAWWKFVGNGFAGSQIPLRDREGKYARQCAWPGIGRCGGQNETERDRERGRRKRGTRRRTLFEESLCEPSPPLGGKEKYTGPPLCTSGVRTYKRFLRDECLLLHTCILQVCESTC